jgi:cell division septum initiation protein DivIVA
MNPSQASLERAHALRQRTRARNFQRPAEREEPAFPIVLRGYDRGAVDEHLDGLNRLIEELRTARSPQAAVRQALDRVGEETSAILQRAHEMADEITESARAEARRHLDAAHRDAESLRSEAERAARALASDSDAVWQDRGSLIEDLRKLAESVLEVADDAAERITKSPAEAVRASADAARARADSEPAPALAEPESNGVPEDEPRVWRDQGQPTEQIDVLALDDEDDEGAEYPHADHEHDGYDAGDSNGPYYS